MPAGSVAVEAAPQILECLVMFSGRSQTTVRYRRLGRPPVELNKTR